MKSTFSKLRLSRQATFDWGGSQISPQAVKILATSIIQAVLRRKLSSVAMSEHLCIPFTAFLSPAAAVVHFSVPLIPEQKISDQRNLILFVHVKKSRISINLLDYFNTREVYKEKSNEVPLRHFQHKLDYHFKLKEIPNQPGFWSICIVGRVLVKETDKWKHLSSRRFRDKIKVVRTLDEAETSFEIVRQGKTRQ